MGEAKVKEWKRERRGERKVDPGSESRNITKVYRYLNVTPFSGKKTR